MSAARRHVRLGFTPELYPEGTHICCLYADEEERRHFLRAFISSGIWEQEAVEYLANVPASQDLEHVVADLAIEELAEGRHDQLEIAPMIATCCADGRFTPDTMLDHLRDMYVRGQTCGCAGSRITGDIPWELRDIPGSDRLVELEAQINNLVKDMPITTLCQYDTRKFDGAIIFDILNVHPLIIVRGQMMHNPFYIPPDQFFAERNAAARVNDKHTSNAAVLGRLLVIQQVLDALPSEVRIGQFVHQALMTVPGVADVYVHIHGHTTPPTPEMETLCKKYEQGSQESTALNFAATNGSPAAHCFPLRTATTTFGFLLVQVADESLLQPYLAFLSNIGNAISIILETRLYQSRLAQANENLCSARDELEVRVAERTRELEQLVTHDRLTGLPNRVLFIDRLQGAIAFARRSEHMVAVIYLDLDSFTYVNTGLGTTCGDKVLKEIAHRLSKLASDNDTVTRIGSDEFVILLTGLESEMQCSAKLMAIREAVRKPIVVKGKSVVVTCSIGACFYPMDGEECELLLRRANAAVHRAKLMGKDSIQFFAESRDSAITERMHLETELRQAIQEDKLVLQYQPKLDLRTNKFVGAEALVRWNHPTKGWISPSDFIPLAEESSLIIELGEWVLKQACLQARIWQDEGIEGAAVAVNLSARQFRNGHIVKTVRKVLRDTGLDPWRLELEITESSIMHDMKHVIGLLLEQKKLGVSISIDDFGTGYSSLSALRDLPADKLKIDKSFVHEIETVKNAAAVALAVIAFAKSLEMRVVAEGVETVGQATFLLRNGCDEIQGYLVACPLPGDQVQEFITRPYAKPWSD